MATCSFKPIINKENRSNKSGLYSLYIRITLDRKSIYLKLDQKIDATTWLGKDGKWIRDSNPLAFQINSLIRSKITSLQEYEIKQRLANNTVTLDKLQKAFSVKGDMACVNDYFKDWIGKQKGKTNGTIKVYRVALMNFNLYNEKLFFNQIDETYPQKFADWLRHDKQFAHPTVIKTVKIFTRVCKDAMKEGHLPVNPFFFNVALKVKPSSSNRIFLSQNEVSAFKNAPIPLDREDLIRARDQWLFCFYAVFYYSDLKMLRWEDVVSSEYGLSIDAKRFKNSQQYISTIYKHPNAIRILESQKGKHPTLVFPDAISSQKFNDKLKVICELAGIKKELNNRAARHSGIQLYISHGLEQAHVAKMVGHKQTSTTAGYYSLTSYDVNERVKKVDFSNLDI
jgi:site-specific recombinase XerD